MSGLFKRLNREPVAVFALIEAVIGIAVALGLDAAIGGSVATIVAVLLGLNVRERVTPVQKVATLVEKPLETVYHQLRQVKP